MKPNGRKARKHYEHTKNNYHTGHTPASRGARNNVYDLDEYDIGYDLACEVAQAYTTRTNKNAYQLISFCPTYRTNDYSDVLRSKFNDINEMNPDLILEFHFNAAASENVFGAELVTAEDQKSRQFARFMLAEFTAYHNLLAPYSQVNKLFMPRRIITPNDLGRDIFILDQVKHPTVIIEFGFLSTDIVARQFQDAVFTSELGNHIEDSLFDYARHNLLTE